MKRRISLLPTSQVLALALFALLAGSSNGSAQHSEAGKVKALIEAYHAAIGARDLAKLEPLWAHDAHVMVINPQDKSISVGWAAVQKDWEAGFKANPNKFNILQAEGPHILVKGNVAWSTGKVTNNTSAGPGVFETDVFEKRGGKWLLVSHTASRLAK